MSNVLQSGNILHSTVLTSPILNTTSTNILKRFILDNLHNRSLDLVFAIEWYDWNSLPEFSQRSRAISFALPPGHIKVGTTDVPPSPFLLLTDSKLGRVCDFKKAFDKINKQMEDRNDSKSSLLL